MNLAISLSENDALRLLCAFKQGRLAELNVSRLGLKDTKRNLLQRGDDHLPELWIAIEAINLPQASNLPAKERAAAPKKHKRA
jgi:hypothetical protein